MITPNPIARLKNLVYTDIEKVNRLIIGTIRSDYSDVVEEVSQHLTKAGGKRLRPLLTLFSAKLLNYHGEHHISLATAVEFIHTATLLHDDVIDESKMRRGITTANLIWGNKTAILVGDYIFSQAFKLMVGSGSIQALETLAETSKIISEAEIWQLNILGDLTNTYSDYLKLIEAKTAALFSAACKVGAIISGANTQYVQALSDYGLFLGIAFQIMDDTLDYTGGEDTFGKKPGNDFLEKKITLPVIIALNDATLEDKKILINRLKEQETTDLQFQETLQLMKKYNAFQKSKEVALKYVNRGKAALKPLKNYPHAELLEDVLDFIINRQV